MHFGTILLSSWNEGGRQKKSELSVIISTTGGMGREAITFYRRLAEKLSRRDATSYSGTLAWIRCTLLFSLLRAAQMCIRGSRSISYRQSDASPELGLVSGPGDY